MRVEVMEVSADQAQEWLHASSDINQRSLSRRRVDKFTHAIIAGQWRLTHQAIAISPDGAVLDGQHRLNAVITAAEAMGASGKELRVPFLVAFDSDPAAFGVIDTGFARTTADTLRIAGYTNTNVTSAAIRTLIVYRAIAGTTREWRGASPSITTQDVLNWLEMPGNSTRMRPAISMGTRIAGNLGRPGLTTVMAGAVLITQEAPKSSAVTSTISMEFFERLSDGSNLSQSSPILTLRRFLISDTGYGRVDGNKRRQTVLGATLTALNAVALGDPYVPGPMFRPVVDIMPRLLSVKERNAAWKQFERDAAEREAQLELPGA